MKVLVTGGAGFIGSTLVDRLLAEGHSVDAVDDLSAGSLANLGDARADPSLDFRFHRVDVRRPDLVDLVVRRQPDVVYHLAVPPRPATETRDPRPDAEQHILGSLNVLEAAVAAGAGKVVVVSAADVYGPVEPEELPIRETHPQRPRTFAGVAARAVGDYLETYRVHHDLEFTHLVLGEVYGPRQNPGHRDGLVAALAARLVAGDACTLPADRDRRRDFVYVDDVVDALARAAGRGGGLVLNVGTGVATSLLDVYQLLVALTGTDLPVVSSPESWADGGDMALDSSRAGIHLGWRPWTTLSEGAAALIASLVERPA